MPGRPARCEHIPQELHTRAAGLLRGQGVGSLYSHQAEAIRRSLSGSDVVIATSTASGKSLVYQAVVLDSLLRRPDAHALFLFPVKALARDQRDSFNALAASCGISATVYDGDTPDTERRRIRSNPPRVLITNPDMLHLGLLAYHETWKHFFSHLVHVVLDEVHTYKGIFGSNVSQVILRMLRICSYHGSNPQFTACSATVSNPGPFVSSLIGRPIEVVDSSGAPCAPRHFLFLNPEQSPYTVAGKLFLKAVESGLKTIVFTQARKITELITTWVLQDAPHLKNRVSSYRAGFLPEERRDIESKLFSGRMDGVISTSALEMGIDVGGLDLCILVGYPGTIVNTWQRGGRVGRGTRPSAVVLIAGYDALDQYFLRNPRDFFDRNCEEAVLDPFNVEVARRHILCAASELPIRPDEEWAAREEFRPVMENLVRDGVLYVSREGFLYSAVKRPHKDVDLRGVGASHAIFLEDGKTLIGKSSGTRALTECHEGAVYLHRAKQYFVTRLDLARRNIMVKPSRLTYYTRALTEKDTEILGAPIRTRTFPGFTVSEARLKVTERVTSYEKRKTSGQELLGTIELNLPPVHFETIGIWLEIPDEVRDTVKTSALQFMGGIHALEHAAISMFPLFALCDRDDIGGISTPQHGQVGGAAVFIYDGHPGGVGLAHRAFEVIEELLQKTRLLVENCPCEDGCPSCIHSPKCGSGNKPLDKQACIYILQFLLNPNETRNAMTDKTSKTSEIRMRMDGTRLHDVPLSPLGTNRANKTGIARNSFGRPVRESVEETGDTTPSGFSVGLRRGKASSSLANLPSEAQAVLPPEQGHLEAPKRDAQVPLAVWSNLARVVVFDLETQRLAQDVGGWKNISRMGLSVGVAHTEEDGFLTFTEENVTELIELLKSADLVVGFNQMRFDYEVLSAYTKENLRALPNLDILLKIHQTLGHRLNLDHLAENTLGIRKSGHGLEAVKWFREGRMDLIEKYCRDDVQITRDLYRFGVENGYLLYRPVGSPVTKIAVRW